MQSSGPTEAAADGGETVLRLPRRLRPDEAVGHVPTIYLSTDLVAKEESHTWAFSLPVLAA
jgi:hypothetical protein